MKFTLGWLREHLETNSSLQEILETLTDIGLEVENVTDPQSKLAGFTIGQITSAEQHPNADRLRLCRVQTHAGEKQIVCGASNARTGIKVVVALPGSYIPGIDTTLSKGKIRGVESEGMMCSERELELSDEHEGIIELDSGTVGTSFVDWLRQNAPQKIDPLIEIAVTPNRPDALGVYGIARDLAARGIGTLKQKNIPEIKPAFSSGIQVSINPETQEDCPLFYGRIIRNVKNGPSPQWLQDRLKAVGLRPVSALVDVTNFMTLDQNRPLHVFDADKIKGNLQIHSAQGQENFEALDGKTYTLEAGMVLISDQTGIQSLGGIMGGVKTECDENTANVFLEAAYFSPRRTAITGRKLKIHSDSRFRFERGIDPDWTKHGLELATQMILDLCGGEASDIVMAGKLPDTHRCFRFDPLRVKTLVGMDIPEEEQRRILHDLGFTIEGSSVFPPSFRPDILGDADIIEEIVRIKSLSMLEGQPIPRTNTGIARPIFVSEAQSRLMRLRREAAALGMNECITYSFIDEKSATAFGGGEDDVRLGNPISQDLSHMRPNLYPGLLKAAASNIARGISDLALFETGQGFTHGEPESYQNMISGILMGQALVRNPLERPRAFDVYDAKAILRTMLQAVGVDMDRLSMRPHTAPWFHPARSAQLGLGPKNILAEFGEIHPKTLKSLGIKGRVIAFALFHDNLPNTKKKTTTRPKLELSAYQAVSRDFAFVVDRTIQAENLVKALMGVDRKLIKSVTVFDVFEGEKAEETLGQNKKSIALSVRLEPQDRTLTDEEIKSLSDALISKAASSTNATLRG